MLGFVLTILGFLGTFILARAFYLTCDAIIMAACGMDHGHGNHVFTPCHCPCHKVKE